MAVTSSGDRSSINGDEADDVFIADGPPEPPLQCIILMYAALVALGGALFGLEISNISNAHVLLCDSPTAKDFCGPTAKDKDFYTGLVTSCVTIGCLIGTLTSGYAQSTLGRKWTAAVACIIYSVGVVVEFVSQTYWVFVLGRVVVGIGCGWFASTVPLYIAELSPSSIRGRLVTSNQLNICIGILVGYIVNKFMDDWRFILGVGIIPAALMFLGFVFVTPYSPRWLVTKGRVEQAREVLSRLRGAENTEFVDWELASIESTSHTKAVGCGKLLEPHALRTLMVGVGISVFQQIVGVNSVNGYAPTILQDAGFNTSDALTLSIIIGVVKVGFVAVALGLMDCLGRKVLLIGGTALMGIAMIVLGVLLQAYLNKEVPQSAADGSAAMLFLGMAAFELGQGPVVWLQLSEIFPLTIRATAMSISASSNFLFNFLVMLTFPLISAPDSLGRGGTFYLYAAICFASCIFTFFMVPETKGRTLEEIEAAFRGRTGTRPHTDADGEAHDKLLVSDA